MKKRLIILAGPTAVGKTDLSIKLASKIGAQIISADSMQVYRHMDIGTAKVTKSEMGPIKHHLIDVLEPTEPFDVSLFRAMAKEAMDKIYQSSDIPMIVGGTGFYIQAALYDIDFEATKCNYNLRQEYENIAKTKGIDVLHSMLLEADPDSAASIPPENIKRTARALEFYKSNGQRLSEHNAAMRSKASPYDFRYFVLTLPREVLYKRIDERVDNMVEGGLLEEVRRLLDMGCKSDMVSMQGLGYKQFIEYLDGKCSLDEAIFEIKKQTRHFAKRQLTWFRRERDVIWVDKSRFDGEGEVLEYIERQIYSNG